jgi:hypothetical protein
MFVVALPSDGGRVVLATEDLIAAKNPVRTMIFGSKHTRALVIAALVSVGVGAILWARIPDPPVFYDPTAKFTPWWVNAYRNTFRAGYVDLALGRPQQALSHFKEAEALPLWEQENYYSWVGEAEALCRLGRKAEGRATLTEFMCANAIVSRRRQCSDLEIEEPRDAAPRPLPDAPMRCFTEICAADLVRDQIEELPLRRQMDRSTRRLVARAERRCQS